MQEAAQVHQRSSREVESDSSRINVMVQIPSSVLCRFGGRRTRRENYRWYFALTETESDSLLLGDYKSGFSELARFMSVDRSCISQRSR